MNPFFAEYISTAKALAADRGLRWELTFNEQGKVSNETRWNLTALAGMLPPPIMWLGQVGVDASSFAQLNDIRKERGEELIAARPMRSDWLDLFIAVHVHQILVRKTKPRSAMKIGVSVRQLAAAAGDTPPWAITGDHVQQAYNSALLGQKSGKAALDFMTMVRAVLDNQRLADIPALARFCRPYRTQKVQVAQKQVDALRERQNAHGGGGSLRKHLSERKAASKLPDERAFWELARIVFTETPQTFSDAIIFAALKVQIMMGFRVGEAASLPLDWKRWRSYVDADGRPAGEHGGVSEALLIRHFAEKQSSEGDQDGNSLYENLQPVPPLFKDVLVETLEFAERITEPLRERLRQQTKAGRVFPEYSKSDLVPAWEMYVRVTGNAGFSKDGIPRELIAKYRESFDPSVLAEIRSTQLSTGRYERLSQFWRGPGQKDIPIRNSSGKELSGPTDWSAAYFLVDDIERHATLNSSTKSSDTSPTRLTDGTQIHPYELLFLLPIRNVIEGRNGGVLDTTLYSAIGRISTNTIMIAVSGRGSGGSLFERYGHTNEDRTLSMTSHALRHLQNTELFRLGVADTIITKKFNRRSVQQSYIYDHRSLAEDLSDIDLPPETEERLGEQALQVFKLISASKARGPVVDEFRRVQAEYGEEAAFDYLNAEADGLHVTPYGLCINSFTSDPCPKHLECFDGCLHLARTNVLSEQHNLERMRDRFGKVIDSLDATPIERRNVGWRNQLAHARMRYTNIVKALGTEPGSQAFPDGRDLSITAEHKAGMTIIDTMKRVRDLDD